MFHRSALYLLPVLLASLLAGCGVFAPHDIVCTADPKFAFKLSVRDSVTNAFSLAGATIVWSSASRADSIAFAPGPGGTDPGYANIYAPSGTYNLTVRKLQYRDWRRSGVQVGSNQCGVVAARIDILLQPIVLPADTLPQMVMDSVLAFSVARAVLWADDSVTVTFAVTNPRPDTLRLQGSGSCTFRVRAYNQAGALASPVGVVVCTADLAFWATLAPRATYTRVFTWRTTDGRMIGPPGPAPLPAGLYDLEPVIDAVAFQWVGRRLRVQVIAK